jgi:type I restriction enzyme S subunit
MSQFNTPQGWINCTLEDVSEGENAIVDGPFGSNLKNSDYVDDRINGVPVLTTKNLEGDYSDDKVRFITKKKFDQLKRSQVNPGDIIVAKIGSIGKNGVYPKGARTAIIPANLLKFTVSSHIAFKYVLFYINYFELQKSIKEISSATAQPAFNVTKFRKLFIPLPPLAEQHRIVAKIEELFSELDKGVETLKTAQEQLKVYRQGVLKYAFEGKLTNPSLKDGELPEGWVEKTLEQITLEKTGLRRGPFGSAIKKEFFVPSGYKVYEQVNAIYDDHKRGKYYITKSKFEELKNFEVKGGDFIVSCSGTLGRISEIPEDAEPGVINQALLRIRLRIGVLSSKYFLHYFRSEIFQRLIFDQSQGTAMNNLIGIKDFKEIKIMLPSSLDEQITIVQEIESRLSVCDKIEESIEQGLQQAEALRQSILKKAFEGKLVPQDPNNEPASVLLERIKAERNSVTPVKKTKTKKTKV